MTLLRGWRYLRVIVCVGVLAIFIATPAHGQARQDDDPRRAGMTRAELEALLVRYEGAAASPAYSETLRERARTEAALLRQRLDVGDFRVGDRIVLTVAGQPTLSDTFVVEVGRLLRLPTIGEVPLVGVMRTELDPYLTDYLGQFLRDPQVHARSLINVAILDAVGQPGFYTLPTEMPLARVFMQAGGPAARAQLDDVRIERGERVIFDGESVLRAMEQGRTLDELNIQDGDRILVPAPSAGLSTAQNALRTVSLLISLPATIFALTQLF